MNEKEPRLEYTLELTKLQLVILKFALEEWCRIRMNQWYTLADDLAHESISPLKDRTGAEFERYIARKECIQAALEAVGEMAFGRYRGYGDCKKSEEEMIAEDVWQVIRYELWNENHDPGDDWSVDSMPPLRQSKEPLPVIKKIDAEK